MKKNFKRWKKSFYRYQQNAVKKFFTANIANLTNIRCANFNAYLKFTGNIIDASDRWRSGIRSCWHPGGEVRTRVRQFLFCKKSGECGEKKISPQKFTPFNAKRCGCFAVKNVFFSPLFTGNLTVFFYHTSTRVRLETKRILLYLICDLFKHFSRSIFFYEAIGWYFFPPRYL